MRLLITGGSGFVGRAVARQLVQDGHEVVVGSRRGAGLPGARGIALDVTDRDQCRARIAEIAPDAVVHLVGIIQERGAQTFERLHVEGTRNVVAALPPGTRYLHMSALGARPDSASGYSRTKAEAERLVRESALPWTIFRPSLIFGLGDDFFGRVLRGLVRLPPVVPVIGDGSFPFRPVSVEDVALAFARALVRDDSIRQTYDLTGPTQYRFDELLRLELGALGRRKPLLKVPLALMRVAVPLMQVLPSPPITRDQFVMLVEGNTADPARARDTFGLPMVRLEDRLPAIVRGDRSVPDTSGRVPGD